LGWGWFFLFSGLSVFFRVFPFFPFIFFSVLFFAHGFFVSRRSFLVLYCVINLYPCRPGGGFPYFFLSPLLYFRSLFWPHMLIANHGFGLVRSFCLIPMFCVGPPASFSSSFFALWCHLKCLVCYVFLACIFHPPRTFSLVFLFFLLSSYHSYFLTQIREGKDTLFSTFLFSLFVSVFLFVFFISHV